jgi:integrase
MSRMRLKGTKKGEPVRTADPVKGPFTDLELQAIITNLNDAFARDQVGVEDFVLIQLLLAIGARPIQLAGLKLGDFSATRADDGTTVYLLRVPRAKQPNQKLRTEFKIRKLSEDLGTLIEAHCQLARTRWADLCTKVDDIPFFVNRTKSNTIDGLQYHSSSDELAIRVQAVFDILSIPSERTGEPINVTSYRFRRTLGTRAAQEGMSELIIAELLDHTDTQNVGVYVEAVPEIVERIDKAMAMHLAPMAQAFAGVLIDGEDEAERAGDVRSRIVSPTALKNPLGNCGSYGFCGAMAPVACYTCRNFQPWVDGPHEEVLDRLIAERERVVAETGDVTIASVNDRVIYACAQVVKLCQRRMAGDAR